MVRNLIKILTLIQSAKTPLVVPETTIKLAKCPEKLMLSEFLTLVFFKILLVTLTAVSRGHMVSPLPSLA